MCCKIGHRHTLLRSAASFLGICEIVGGKAFVPSLHAPALNSYTSDSVQSCTTLYISVPPETAYTLAKSFQLSFGKCPFGAPYPSLFLNRSPARKTITDRFATPLTKLSHSVSSNF